VVPPNSNYIVRSVHIHTNAVALAQLYAELLTSDWSDTLAQLYAELLTSDWSDNHVSKSGWCVFQELDQCTDEQQLSHRATLNH